MKIVMMGATGAVGNEVVKSLLQKEEIQNLTLLGRSTEEGLSDTRVKQHKIDIFSPETYKHLLPDHEVAICTLGVGQPSKMSRDDFIKIDKHAVLDFAIACKSAGTKHFELLSSVGINARSNSFFLRAKGELVDEIKALNFERFSVFQPSMILTPTNRYGLSQGIVLKIWPSLHPFLLGSLMKLRGVKVEVLGNAIAMNIFEEYSGLEFLTWSEFEEFNQSV